MRVCLVLILLTLAAPVSAQDDSIEEPAADPHPHPSADPHPHASAELDLRVGAGRLARERGDFERALVDFRAAYELAPSADRLLDIADALDAMRRDGELRAAYRAYLALDPQHARAEEIRARLAVLDAAAALPPPELPAEVPVEEETYEEEEEHDIFDEEWFWAVVAIVVAGGLFGVVYASEQRGVEDPIPGDGGFIIGTLVELP